MITPGIGLLALFADGVHDPGHDLAGGVDVGRGHVLPGADYGADLAGVAPGEVLQLVEGELFGVDDDAALAPAVGEAGDGALPGHPRRQGPDLVEADVGVVADAALVGAEGVVVLHPVAGEHPPAAVVHLDGEVDGELALAGAELAADAVVETHDLGDGVELGHRVFVGVADCGFGGAGCLTVTHGSYLQLKFPEKTYPI